MQRDVVQSEQKPITVLIADDHPISRAGIRAILGKAPDIRVVGEADNGFQTEKLATKLRPNILLLDFVMSGATLMQLEKLIHANSPETITLILTTEDRDSYLSNMIDAGAAGFLSKTEPEEKLILAIRRVMTGKILFTKEQFARADRWRKKAGGRWKNMTRREKQTLLLIVQGIDNKGIAKALGITVKTVSYHVSNILKKLDAKSRHEAIAWANKYLPDNLE